MIQAELWTLAPSYTPGDFVTLRMCNETISRVVGIYTIFLETSVGNKLVFKNMNMLLMFIFTYFPLVF